MSVKFGEEIFGRILCFPRCTLLSRLPFSCFLRAGALAERTERLPSELVYDLLVPLEPLVYDPLVPLEPPVVPVSVEI